MKKSAIFSLSFFVLLSCTPDQNKFKEDSHGEFKIAASANSYAKDSLFYRLNDLYVMMLDRSIFSSDLFDSFSFEQFEVCSKNKLNSVSQPDNPNEALLLFDSILDSCNVEDQIQRDWFSIRFDFYLTIGQLVEKYPQLENESNLLLHLDSLMTFPIPNPIN
jgi:hypothetical protein